MYDPLSDNPSTRTFLAELLDTRGAKFNYVDRQRKGLVKTSAYLYYILNSLAGCLGIPVLLYISFHAIKIYLTNVTQPTALLSVLFYAITLSIFLDFLVGYLYDKLMKAGLYPVKAAFNILGTIGYALAVVFIFRHDVSEPEALTQFRWTILLLAACYPFCNTNSFKNSAMFTPSQEDRTRLLYIDYVIKGFFILFFLCLPYWMKFWTDACSCGPPCSASPGHAVCFDCLNACDSFGSNLIFRDVAMAFTGFFAVANIVAEFIVRPRVDEEVEQIETTFNRRVSELFNNGLFVKSFLVLFFQFLVLFGFAFWVSYYLDDKSPPIETCTRFWGTAAYLCSKSWMKTLTYLLPLLLTIGYLVVADRKSKLLKYLAWATAGLLLIAGILEIIIGSSQGVIYIFIAIFMADFFALLPTNELLYTNAMFYDEYQSGANQSYLTSSLYQLAVKCGFFTAAAFHVTLYRALGTETEEATNINSDGFGALTIFTTALLVLLGWSIYQYDFHAFDKIQLAIERNLNDVVEGFNFYDPIGKRSIRRPVTSHDETEKTLIALLYNLDPRDDLKLALSSRQNKLQSNALVRIFLFFILLVGFTAVVIAFAEYLDSRWGWFLLIGLVVLPISAYGMLYNYNVWQTAHALNSNKYKGADRLFMSRFNPLIEDRPLKDPIV